MKRLLLFLVLLGACELCCRTRHRPGMGAVTVTVQAIARTIARITTRDITRRPIAGAGITPTARTTAALPPMVLVLRTTAQPGALATGCGRDDCSRAPVVGICEPDQSASKRPTTEDHRRYRQSARYSSAIANRSVIGG